MYYDQQSSALERRAAQGLAPPPDAHYAKEWDSMEVASQLVCFAAPYSVHTLPEAAREAAIGKLIAAGDAVTPSTLCLKRKDQMRFEIDRERAKRNGETMQEAPAVVFDNVLGGPEFLYREPRVLTKPQLFLKSSIPIPNSKSSLPSLMESVASVHFVDDDRTRAVRECRLALEEAYALREQLQSSSSSSSLGGVDDSVRTTKPKKFFDATFFPGKQDSLYPEGTPSDTQAVEPHNVMRLSSLFPEGLVFDPDPVPYAIVSTTMRLPHMVAAMDALRYTSAGRSLLMELLVTRNDETSAQDSLFEDGMIGILFRVDGRWDWVIIDDTFPVDASRRPLFLATTRWEELMELEARFGCPHTPHEDPQVRVSWEPPQMVELWPLLLLKGIAKRLGGFSALDGRGSWTFSDGMMMVTGCLPLPHRTLSDDGDVLDLIQLLTDKPNTAVLLHPRSAAAGIGGVMGSGPLPCILAEVSTEEIEPRIDVYSPWGTMRRAASSSFKRGGPFGDEHLADEVHFLHSLSIQEFRSLFEEVECFRFLDGAHPMVSYHGVSTPGHPSLYQLTVSTAIRTHICLSVEQADPRLSQHLPFRDRQTLPFASLQWRILCGPDGAGECVFSSQRQVSRQVADYVPLECGSYIIEVRLEHGPAVPFRLIALGPATALLGLTPFGLDAAVHGVSTKTVQGCIPPKCLADKSKDGESMQAQVLGEVMTRRASRLLRPNILPAVQDAFHWADILGKEELTHDAAQRAFMKLLLDTTPGGQEFSRLLQVSTKQSPTGGIDVAKFNEIVGASFAAGLQMPSDNHHHESPTPSTSHQRRTLRFSQQ